MQILRNVANFLSGMDHKVLMFPITVISSGGHAYCLGSPKRPDCWYLYTLNPIQDVNNNMDLGCHGNSQDEDDIPDQTLEILMHDLDPKVMQLFTKAQSTSATDATEVSVTLTPRSFAMISSS